MKFFEKWFGKKPAGRKYGWQRDVPDFRDMSFSLPIQFRNAVLPAKVDLRNLHVVVFQQDTLGSCTANAIATAHLFDQIKQQSKTPVVPSRLFIYYNEREIEGTIGTDSGAQIRDGIKSIARQGVCHEESWPYIISKFAKKPSDKCYVEAMDHQAVQYSVVNQNLNDLRACLAAGFPIIFGFAVYESFETEMVATTGIMPMPKQTERMKGGHAVLCLSEDTKIPLLNGKEKTLKELYEEYGSGEFWVYSSNDAGEIVAGKAHSLTKTGVDKKLIEIVLDNNKTVKCTTNHQFMMRDGTYKEAQNLLPGDSLMPLYRKLSNRKGMNGYEMVFQPNTKKWEYTHRAVRSSIEKYSGTVHHSDFNKLNNDPDNLVVMSWDEHTKFHKENSISLSKYSKSEIGRAKSRKLMEGLWDNKEWRNAAIKRAVENGKKVSKKLSEKGICGFQIIKNIDEFKKACSLRAKKNSWNLHTDSAEIKCREVLKNKRLNDEIFRDKSRITSVLNLKKYNEDLKSGKIKLTEKQIAARKNNAKNNFLDKEKRKLASLKSVWTRWYKNKYLTFEDFLASKKNDNCQNNHKVTEIRSVDNGDVFDLTVDTYHNFAVSSGVFVHNCMGYDNANRMFLIQNSWGTGWGQKGFFWMPYDFMVNPRLASDFWVVRLVEV